MRHINLMILKNTGPSVCMIVCIRGYVLDAQFQTNIDTTSTFIIYQLSLHEHV